MSDRRLKVALTTGDPDGIGFEVTAKALFNLGPQKKTNFFIFRDHKQEDIQKTCFKLLDKKFSRLTFYSLSSALAFYTLLDLSRSHDDGFLFDLCLQTNAADWVIDSTLLCKIGTFNSLVTAPISKTLIQKSGYPFVGHTGIFRSFFPKSNLFMGFVGEKFNVVLATDHIGLSEVETSLSLQKIHSALKACVQLKNLIKSKKPIALLGLNPHAGENGVISSFEKKLTRKISSTFKVSPFLSPDAAFLKNNWDKYSVFLALYHDQGLIPFKLIHGQNSGVHITLGLPFLRTSVDHGTAKNIFNKNRANPNSMQEAIMLNLKFLKKGYTL